MSGVATLNPALFHPGLYRNILKLWFNDLPYPASTAPYPVISRWYGSESTVGARAVFDEQCHSTGKNALDSIGPEQYPLPASPPTSSRIAEPFLTQITQGQQPAPEETALAMILLLDQLPRNCYRDNQKLIYNHYDRISRSVLQEIIHHQLDGHQRYRDSPPWSLWFYMPLTHSEDLQDHKRYMDILSGIKSRMEDKGDKDAASYVAMSIDFEKRHNVLLERFGRYPHRNKVLGRESTAGEREYLENGGETFGT